MCSPDSQKDGAYAFPNDEVESDRLDMQHHEFQLIFDGKLFTAPIPKDKVLHRVLDIGTGTGIWAIDFADDHPESSVLGVDLSPIQPSFLPPNVKFEVDDVEAPWTYTQKFDFIYSRMMMCSFDNYPKFFEQAFANLEPGGFLEMADPTWPIMLNDGKWPEDSALFKWYASSSCSLPRSSAYICVGQHYGQKVWPRWDGKPIVHDCTKSRWKQLVSRM